MEEPCTVQMWWVHPSNLALVMLAGFALVVAMKGAPDRPLAIEADRNRG